MLLTFSGAHGCGKTTLIKALEKVLRPHTSQIAPSFSHQLIGSLGRFGVEKYDDINNLGIRCLFQNLILAQILELHREIVTEHHYAQDKLFFLSDRWIPDAYAYTMVEKEMQPYIQAWYTAASQLETMIDKSLIGNKIDVYHFVIKYTPFPLQEKASRATVDPYEIDKYIMDWVMQDGEFLKPHVYIINAVTIEDRINQVVEILKRKHPDASVSRSLPAYPGPGIGT